MTRLSEGLEHKLTLISASAGAGKTTLLCEWSESPHGREVPLIWVSLDEGDNDPSLCWLLGSSVLKIGPLVTIQKDHVDCQKKRDLLK